MISTHGGMATKRSSLSYNQYFLPSRFAHGSTDWDRQRAEFIAENPGSVKGGHGRPKVMIVTNSPPEECKHSMGDFMLVKALKNKLDYSKQKKFKVFHNMATFDGRMGGSWGKLPLLRNFMVTHPEVEWFWWIEADSVITGTNMTHIANTASQNQPLNALLPSIYFCLIFYFCHRCDSEILTLEHSYSFYTSIFLSFFVQTSNSTSLSASTLPRILCCTASPNRSTMKKTGTCHHHIRATNRSPHLFSTARPSNVCANLC